MKKFKVISLFSEEWALTWAPKEKTGQFEIVACVEKESRSAIPFVQTTKLVGCFLPSNLRNGHQ
jgi:hypothetical protein